MNQVVLDKMTQKLQKVEEDNIKTNLLLKNKTDAINTTIFTINAKLEYMAKYNIPEYIRPTIINEQGKQMEQLYIKIKQRTEVKEGSVINETNIDELKSFLSDLGNVIAQQKALDIKAEQFSSQFLTIDSNYKAIMKKCSIFKYVDWIDGDIAKYKGQPIFGTLHEQASIAVKELFEANKKGASQADIDKIVLGYNTKKNDCMKQYIKDLQDKMSGAIAKFKSDMYSDIINSKRQEIEARIKKLVESNEIAAKNNQEITPMNKILSDFGAEFDELIERLTPIVYMKEFYEKTQLIHYIDPVTFLKSTEDVSNIGINTTAQSISVGKKIYFIGGDLVATTLYLEAKNKVNCNDMHAAKYSHGLTYWDGIIYSVGGFNNFCPERGDDPNNEFFMKDVECYNISDNTWTRRSNLLEGRRSMAVFISKNKYLYAVSGVMDKVNSNHLVERQQISSPENVWAYVEIKNINSISRCFLSGFMASNNEAIILGSKSSGRGYRIELDDDKRECKEDCSTGGYCDYNDSSAPIVSYQSVFVTLNSSLFQYDYEQKKEVAEVPQEQIQEEHNALGLNIIEKEEQGGKWMLKLDLHPKTFDQLLIDYS